MALSTIGLLWVGERLRDRGPPARARRRLEHLVRRRDRAAGRPDEPGRAGQAARLQRPALGAARRRPGAARRLRAGHDRRRGAGDRRDRHRRRAHPPHRPTNRAHAGGVLVRDVAQTLIDRDCAVARSLRLRRLVRRGTAPLSRVQVPPGPEAAAREDLQAHASRLSRVRLHRAEEEGRASRAADPRQPRPGHLVPARRPAGRHRLQGTDLSRPARADLVARALRRP